METFIFYSVLLLWCTQIISLFALFLLFRQFGEVYLSTGEGISKDGLPVGKSIPELNVFSLKKNQQVESTQIINRPAIMSFLSPNCKPCEALIKDWNIAYGYYGETIDFFVVFLGEEEEVKTMVKKNHIAGEHLWDQGNDLFHRFRVRVTPFAFAVDGDGVVMDKGLCGSKEQIDLLVSSIIKNKIKATEGSEKNV